MIKYFMIMIPLFVSVIGCSQEGFNKSQQAKMKNNQLTIDKTHAFQLQEGRERGAHEREIQKEEHRQEEELKKLDDAFKLEKLQQEAASKEELTKERNRNKEVTQKESHAFLMPVILGVSLIGGISGSFIYFTKKREDEITKRNKHELFAKLMLAGLAKKQTEERFNNFIVDVKKPKGGFQRHI